jgi:F-type H+-transporting ATPase subunit gamma
MPNLKEIRIRIASVNSTRQITSAMKMVSAAKLRRAQDAVVQLRPYASKLDGILQSISDNVGSSNDNVFGKERPLNKVLIVVITSNKGLCGAFNSNVIKKSVQLINGEFGALNERGKVELLTIGKKGFDFFRTRNYKIVKNHSAIYDKISFEKVIPVVEEVMNSFENREYDKVILVYNQFKNAAVQILTDEQFLPIRKQKKTEKNSFAHHFDFMYEPSQEYMLKELLPKSLKIQFYKALLDSYAAEHGARMTAMHKATDNAGELLKELNLTFNKARQGAITKEILEIVGGANALKK